MHDFFVILNMHVNTEFRGFGPPDSSIVMRNALGNIYYAYALKLINCRKCIFNKNKNYHFSLTILITLTIFYLFDLALLLNSHYNRNAFYRGKKSLGNTLFPSVITISQGNFPLVSIVKTLVVEGRNPTSPRENYFLPRKTSLGNMKKIRRYNFQDYEIKIFPREDFIIIVYWRQKILWVTVLVCRKIVYLQVLISR